MRPKVSTAAAPPPPVMEDTDAVKQEYQDRLRQRHGRAASILTDQSKPQTQQTAAKVLLGS